MSTGLGARLSEGGHTAGDIAVSLSNQLIPLLSEQLYKSPLKAIEELVVNSYDADAETCRLFVPTSFDEGEAVVVFDDGIGMDVQGFSSLWLIGESIKNDEAYYSLRKRAQIGKFGIGKLATYAIANQITFFSRRENAAFHISINFDEFKNGDPHHEKTIHKSVTKIDDVTDLSSRSDFAYLCSLVKLKPASLLGKKGRRNWTFCVLEELKPRARDLQIGRLRWVLQTAMPTVMDFKVYLNGEDVGSSKQDWEKVVEFQLSDLPDIRLTSIQQKTGQEIIKKDGKLYSELLPQGIFGKAFVTRKSLVGNKSELLMGRSHGFFIRVRGRVINPVDPSFGLHPGSHQTFNRFCADISADDLHEFVTADRDAVEDNEITDLLKRILNEVFLHARSKFEDFLREDESKHRRAKEHERNYISPRYFDYALGDVFSNVPEPNVGGDADSSWFYMSRVPEEEIRAISERFYGPERRKYKYEYHASGVTGRAVVFDPNAGIFRINEDHDFVRAYSDDPRARTLLEDVLTAESLLEVYMRESGIHPSTIGEVLEQRDSLLRNLAQDKFYSLPSIAGFLRDSYNNDHNLEIAIVAAMRSIGFITKHIAGPGEPDGIARLPQYDSAGEIRITIEAKSSDKTPTLAQLDFAGVEEHKEKHSAAGCLLVAPSFPAVEKDNSAVNTRAKAARISCWTIELLAELVEQVEDRQITAKEVADIILASYTPLDVTKAVAARFSAPNQNKKELYKTVIDVLWRFSGKLERSPRKISHIAALVVQEDQFSELDEDTIRDAVKDLAHASKGAMRVAGDEFINIFTSMGELSRRVSGLTGQSGRPRRKGAFREMN